MDSHQPIWYFRRYASTDDGRPHVFNSLAAAIDGLAADVSRHPGIEHWLLGRIGGSHERCIYPYVDKWWRTPSLLDESFYTI